MARNNPYYQRCIYLETVFVDYGISSYCKHTCTLFGQRITASDHMRTMCCISNSPYMQKNCKFFKDVTGTQQMTLGD